MFVIKKKDTDIFCSLFLKSDPDKNGKIERRLKTTKNIESAEYFEHFGPAEKARIERGLTDYNVRNAVPLLIERIEKLKKKIAKK